MSTLPNVARLADFERRSRPPAAEELRQTEEILQDLEKLPEKPDFTEVETLTAELARALCDAKLLKIAATRERYVQILDGKLQAPARFFDSALADCTGSPARLQDQEQGRSLSFENPEPWPEKVVGSELLGDLRSAFRRFVVLSEEALTVLALWVVHSFAFDVAWITPRLAITSPEKRCGKTLVLTLLRCLVAKPLLTANASPAAVYRAVEKVRPTLLIDEADTFLAGKDELRGILNSGHQRDGCVLRTVGDDHEARAFSTFAPCAIAMIGTLPDTLDDRSIAVRMARKRPGEKVDRLRIDRLGHLEELRRRAVRWASDVRERLVQADPEVPEELNDRAADNWRALLAIADAAGGEWPELARKAATESAASKDEDPSTRVRLLEDLRAIFERSGQPKMFSRDIVAKLLELEDRPWPEWKRGKPLTVRQLAGLLLPFGAKPQHLRIGDTTGRGYLAEDLEDAFDRYLASPIRNIRNIPSESETYDGSRSVTPEGAVTDRKQALEPVFTGLVTDVTDRKPDEEPRSREVAKL